MTNGRRRRPSSRPSSHLLKWEDAKRISASLELAKSEPDVPILPGDLDCDPMLLNCPDCTIDLRTGKALEHRREDYLTKLCPVPFDPAATCPLWLKVLDRIMDGNQDLVSYLQRVVGYCLTGDVREQVLWFFHGVGANGKSTFLNVIRALMGGYAMQSVSELLMAKTNESHPTERADLCGRRLVCTIETDDGKRLAESLLKQLTGGDTVRARKMHQDFFEFAPTWKIILAANHKPVVKGTDHAIWRRIKLVPFTVTIPPEEKDANLAEKLKLELPGILAWGVPGCLDWQRSGMQEPEEIRAATDAYRAEQDTLAAFIVGCCVSIREARVQASRLFDAYQAWSGDRWTTQKSFTQKMEGARLPVSHRHW